MKHLNLILGFFLLFVGVAVQAQDEPMQNRWFTGGNFGLSFGTYTFVNISPQIGYRFTDKVAAGGGVNFQYISDRTRVNGETVYRTNRGVGGLNVFGRFYPVPQFMVQVQPEANYVWGKDKDFINNQEFRFDPRVVPSLLLGGGLVLPTGRNALIISAFYDVIQDPDAPYGRRPIVNFGYNLGF
ncbi:hypothetical protein SAMN05444008_11453 [Cnuella takakiae]|uniref:Outer membrane protein beta-barrel domain-containing protein n=1 Tax=Cnuella takakiae TaxID=1302690 RepID=A0A1M5FKK7_9BACT|nr:hypothetical protein [Cnuella takakiae]OLY93728.1 hypothetical protein BUE76_18945 [Cnuella takakiae]SHF92147.1 hypothetical protein SAMN05444008_11453 [Cnuella takakiae]